MVGASNLEPINLSLIVVIVLACCSAAFIYLQVHTLIRLRQKMRIASICCAVLMAALGTISLAGTMQGSILAPLLMVFSLPVASAYLLALLAIDARLVRRTRAREGARPVR